MLPVPTSRPPHMMMIRCSGSTSSNLSLDGQLRHLTLARGRLPFTSGAGRQNIHSRSVAEQDQPSCDA